VAAGADRRPEHHVGGRGVFAVAAEVEVERVTVRFRKQRLLDLLGSGDELFLAVRR